MSATYALMIAKDYAPPMTLPSISGAGVASLVKSLLFDRYLLVAVPPAVAALAVALNTVSKVRAGMIVALLLLTAIVGFAYGIAAKEWKPDWGELTAYLADCSTSR